MAVVVALACAAVAGCGESAGDGVVRTDDPAAAFAPLVRYHAGEFASVAGDGLVSAYVERRRESVRGEPGLRLTYWVPVNGSERVRVAVLLRGEGDEYEPVAVTVPGARGAARELPWAGVRAVAGDGAAPASHPVVNATRDSRGLDARPRPCRGCTPWRTWDRLRPAPGQSWYGFTPPWAKPVATRRPALAFAPLVRFHSRESAFPMDAERFIQRSSLKWKDGPCLVLDDVATGSVAERKTPGRVPRVRSSRLGAPGAYERRVLDARCRRPRGPAYSTTDYTRPYDLGVGRAPLAADQGFYLDRLSDSRDGDPRFRREGGELLLAGVPAYHHREFFGIHGGPGLRITYWFLYPHTESFDARGEDIAGHEGGWERVDVVAVPEGRGGNRWTPVALVLYQHRFEPWTVPWRDVELAPAGPGDGPATHPVVFASRASHIPHASPGVRRRGLDFDGARRVAVDRAEACGRCVRWRTWERLSPLRSQPWRGFGGGWGFAFRNDGQSGPLGPTPFSTGGSR
jgi:hypothetical protein